MKLYFDGEPKAVAQLPSGWKPLWGPVAISLRFIFPPLKCFTKGDIEFLRYGGAIYKTTKPDLTDNLAKGLIDALSGLAWKRDQQICKEYGREKVYGLHARTIVFFEELSPACPQDGWGE